MPLTRVLSSVGAGGGADERDGRAGLRVSGVHRRAPSWWSGRLRIGRRCPDHLSALIMVQFAVTWLALRVRPHKAQVWMGGEGQVSWVWP